MVSSCNSVMPGYRHVGILTTLHEGRKKLCELAIGRDCGAPHSAWRPHVGQVVTVSPSRKIGCLTRDIPYSVVSSCSARECFLPPYP